MTHSETLHHINTAIAALTALAVEKVIDPHNTGSFIGHFYTARILAEQREDLFQKHTQKIQSEEE